MQFFDSGKLLTDAGCVVGRVDEAFVPEPKVVPSMRAGERVNTMGVNRKLLTPGAPDVCEDGRMFQAEAEPEGAVFICWASRRNA